MCGNLASLHMRNFGCAIVVYVELRGDFRVVVWCRVVVCSCSCFLSFLRFLPFPLSCVLGAFVGVEELKRDDILRFVYIFRFGVGVGSV